MKMFLVGGAVRDKLMGKDPKDLDFTVVLEDTDLSFSAGPFETMVANLELQGFKIFLKSPEHLTVRARFPKGSEHERMTGDFVLARKESDYSDGRHPDKVEVGTLLDDLRRRDFRMNAIAEDMETGELIDPFDGEGAIALGLVEAVGKAKDRMMEDSLRALRAIRFMVQLGFNLDDDVGQALRDEDVIAALVNVSDERKKDELNKMFKADSFRSIQILNEFEGLSAAVFAGKVNLEATMKTKGFSDKKTIREQGKSKLAPAYGGCQCSCHTQRGVMHMAACCRPEQKEFK